MRALPFPVLAVLVLTSTAWAKPLLEPPSPVPTPNDDGEETPLVPPAKDTLGGHFVAGADAAYAFPFGDFTRGVSAADLGDGLGLGLDLGFGISRSLVIGAWGQYLRYGQNPDCGAGPRPQDGCTGLSYAVGPFIRYHLVQGMRFDPWLVAGFGYRGLTVKSSAGSASYAGVEWLRIGVGGDYYPTQLFGIGPLLELDVGTFYKRPDQDAHIATHLNFVAGLRIVLDVPGK